MSAPQFTPGPWHFDGYPEGQIYEVANADRLVCGCEFELEGDEGQWPRMAESRANAHLIAAAPELYEALLLMKHSYTVGTPSFENGDAGKAHKLAEAALAKARGES